MILLKEKSKITWMKVIKKKRQGHAGPATARRAVNGFNRMGSHLVAAVGLVFLG